MTKKSLTTSVLSQTASQPHNATGSLWSNHQGELFIGFWPARSVAKWLNSAISSKDAEQLTQNFPRDAMIDLATRLEALETRVAYQDQTIDDLNMTITAQWRQIDVLTRKLDTVEQQLRSGVQIADPASEQPPPHY